ncbi:MAG: DNA polymerase III, subunit gamma and tau [Deltaproteobacteria bacterium HGW-Deltaproteobacteria-8]|jgi:DNA polymerase-3 subunit gamma/tau|nr:MAG: DNA polymerase III, subunit gamma and tau [Deltaproteobacteria bacterium HGW-Deltaproteobacteria-8]
MASLTAKYRPRRFAEVAGQDAVKAILSRASATGKIAPAYMFSGTRGVGKTTIARIFAKALNCEKAPTAEPCNECAMCRQALAGTAVDIIEIDAASHGGVGDVRALKEDVGYAPLEGRFKVFIIDEAHMLSTAAFNALLKTLEEPPGRVTFILASTEAHKFPATILSRCQHYVFKMLPQADLAAHLEGLLVREGLEFEPAAVRIIARRGAGSVRDSMSLLGQALAYSTGKLLESEVRGCLGLAGQEVFFALMEAIQNRDLPLLTRTLRLVLDQGLDLGFFLRELSSCWRNMFLLRQAGEAILPELGLPAEEAAQWQDWAKRFTPAHIHACWQMTLDGQQRVIKSLEPAQSLELLLLNLACLPDLIPLEALGGQPSSGPASGGAAGRGPGGATSPGSASRTAPPTGPPAGSEAGSSTPASTASATPASTAAATASSPLAPAAQSATPPPWQATGPTASSTTSATASAPPLSTPQATDSPAPRLQESPSQQAAPAAPAPAADSAGPVSWEGFQAFVAAKNGSGMITGLAQAQGEWAAGVLTLGCHNGTHCNMLSQGDNHVRLQRLVLEYFGPQAGLEFSFEEREPQRSGSEVDREVQANPAVQRVREAFEIKTPGQVTLRERR